MAQSFSTPPTLLGSSGGISVYRVDLSAFAFSTIRGIVIDDDGTLSGNSLGRSSGIDLDFVLVSNTLTSGAATARGLVGQNVFNFASGVALQNGYVNPSVIGENGAWSSLGLLGSVARDQLNNSIATLGISDATNSPSQGFVSLGDGGRISFTLNSDLATTGNYLYFGLLNAEGARVSVTDAAGPDARSGQTLFGRTGTPVGGADYIAMQQGMNSALGAGNDTIDGQSGNDTIYGGDGDDYLIGGTDNDQLFGGDGTDQIYGGDGNDYLQADGGQFSIMSGDAGADTIYGGSGNDYIVGGAGNDTMVGLGGVNSLYGGDGNDYMVSGDGPNNVLDGGAGANSLWGGGGAEYAVGGEGADIIVTFGGDDYLFGNAGNDAMYAGAGTDYIYSNAGNDFIYTDDFGFSYKDYVYVGPGTGIDTVVDFKAGSAPDADVIVMSTTAARSLAAVLATAQQVGLYTIIQVSTTDQLYLYNVAPTQLTADNFIFL